MNIEKLGIRRLEIFTVNADGNIKVRFADLLEKETIYNEMLEALIIEMRGRVRRNNYLYGKDNHSVKIIQKATGKKWEEIKDLLNAN